MPKGCRDNDYSTETELLAADLELLMNELKILLENADLRKQDQRIPAR